MGNSYTSPNQTVDVPLDIQLDEIVSSNDLRRLENLWGGNRRRFMTRDDFFNKIFTHPDIPDEIQVRIFSEICRGAPVLDFYNFAFAIGLIGNTDPHTRNIFLPETKILNGCVFLSKFSESSVADDQTIYQILAGVTHLDESEVADLERVFTDIYDPVLQKISVSDFENLLTGMASPGMVDGIFSAFDVNQDGFIDFKEFVCGLSALCRGPESARLLFMAQIWDPDGDGFLTTDDLDTFRDDLSLDKSLKCPPGESIGYPDFVCWIIANPSVQNRMLSLGNQIGNIGLRLCTSSTSEYATCNTTLDSEGIQVARQNSCETLAAEKLDASKLDASTVSTGRLLAPVISRPRVGGVVNMGNSCYISAALQSLTNVRELTLHLLARTENSLGPVAREYMQFLHKVYIEGESAVPRTLKDAVSKKTSQFADRSQHDCQEFLTIFLDTLHEDLKPKVADCAKSTVRDESANTEGNGDEGKESEKEPEVGDSEKPLSANVEKHGDEGKDSDEEEPEVNDSEKAKQKWALEMSRQGSSAVIDLFAGQLKSNLRCLHCAHSSSTFELFTVISLSIPVNDRLLVFVKVFRRSTTVPKRCAFRVPTATKLREFRELISHRVDILSDRMQILLVDKYDGKFDLAHSEQFNSDSNLAVKDLPLTAMDICCYELAPHLPTEVVGLSQFVNIICVHRKITHKQIYAIKEIDGVSPVTFGFPFVLSFPAKLTGRMLYDKIWAHIQGRTSANAASSKRVSSASIASTQFRVNRAIDADERYRSGYPFELAFTSGDALWCAHCDWTRFCRGCTLPSSDEELMIADGKRQDLLTVNWKPIALYLDYGNQLDVRCEDDVSVTECSAAHSRPLSLDDCFSDYTRPETLGDSRCDKCKCVTNREKSLRISRLPHILMVHLKRFVYVPSVGRHVKSSVQVNFPLENFDPSPYLTTADNSNNAQNPVTYNCTAIVNHHGQMNFGHYTTIVRDQYSNPAASPGQSQWTFFNDNYSKFVERPETKNAYLLFYERNPRPEDGQPV